MGLMKPDSRELAYDPVEGPKHSRAIRDKLRGTLPHRQLVVLPPPVIRPAKKEYIKIEKPIRPPRKRGPQPLRELSEIEQRLRKLITASPLRRKLDPWKVIEGVCSFYRIPQDVLLLGMRKDARARHVACFLLRTIFPKMTYWKISIVLQIKGPQQVSYNFSKIVDDLETDVRLQADLLLIVGLILGEEFVAAPE